MSKKIKIILLVVICFLLVASSWLYYDCQNKKFEVVFFDVGQGDAALINLPGNNEILIDGGPDMTVLYKLGRYLPIYDRSIELMILTHPHADHLTGLVEVLNRYEVKKVMYTGIDYDSGIYREFTKILKRKNIKTIWKNKIDFGKGNYLEIVYPWENLENKKIEDINNSSIVVKLDTPNADFLFTGDIGIDVEKKILEEIEQENLKADVLKVGHQGSDTSSGIEFVEAVNPNYAIISVGENDYGHPSLRVIRRLERLGAQVLRTDKEGDVRFSINRKGELEVFH